MQYEQNVMKYCDDRYSGRPYLWIPTKLYILAWVFICVGTEEDVRDIPHIAGPT